MDNDAELSMAALVRDGVVRVRRQPLALARVVRRSWWRRLLAWRPWARAAIIAVAVLLANCGPVGPGPREQCQATGGRPVQKCELGMPMFATDGSGNMHLIGFMDDCRWLCVMPEAPAAR